MDADPRSSADDLAVGATRPTMVGGITYIAAVVIAGAAACAVMLTQRLEGFLIAPPAYGICYLICQYDPRAFELLFTWLRTKGENLYATLCLISTYSPLSQRIQDGFWRRLLRPRRKA